MAFAGKRESRHRSRNREFSGEKCELIATDSLMGSVNSTRADFELDFKLPTRKTQRKLSESKCRFATHNAQQRDSEKTPKWRRLAARLVTFTFKRWSLAKK